MEAVDSIKKGDASSLKKILNRVEPRAENWINQEIKTEGGKTLLLIAIGNEVSLNYIKQLGLKDNLRLSRGFSMETLCPHDLHTVS